MKLVIAACALFMIGLYSPAANAEPTPPTNPAPAQPAAETDKKANPEKKEEGSAPQPTPTPNQGK